MNVFVQFSDAYETVIASVFGCAQDSATYPNQAILSDTDPRYLAFLNPVWPAYQQQAQSALDKSDVTILRCTENSVTVPTAWATYRAALRAIVRATTGDATLPLPTRPAYPSGT